MKEAQKLRIVWGIRDKTKSRNFLKCELCDSEMNEWKFLIIKALQLGQT